MQNPVKNRNKAYILYVGANELAKPNKTSPVNEMYQIFLLPHLSAKAPRITAPTKVPAMRTD